MGLIGRNELIVEHREVGSIDAAIEDARAMVKIAAAARNAARVAYTSAERELELARSLLRRLEARSG